MEEYMHNNITTIFLYLFITYASMSITRLNAAFTIPKGGAHEEVNINQRGGRWLFSTAKDTSHPPQITFHPLRNRAKLAKTQAFVRQFLGVAKKYRKYLGSHQFL